VWTFISWIRQAKIPSDYVIRIAGTLSRRLSVYNAEAPDRRDFKIGIGVIYHPCGLRQCVNQKMTTATRNTKAFTSRMRGA